MSKRSSLLVCTFCVLLGVFFAQLPASIAQIRANLNSASAGPGDDSKVDWAAAFAEVRRLILDKHVDKPSDELLLKGAIEAASTGPRSWERGVDES